MANDLATLNSHLDTMLRENVADDTWTSTEKNNVLTWAVARLQSRFARPLDPSAAANQITLAADTYYYSLPSGCKAVSRVDYVGADGTQKGPLANGTWELVGDVYAGSGKLHVSPQVVLDGDELWIHGYGSYDLTTNYPQDYLLPLILAMARAELYRRLVASRENFKEWLARNQTQNISINELIQMVNEADREAKELWATTPKTWQKPVPGRVG